MTHQILITGMLNPDPLTMNRGDAVVWTNNTAAVQNVNSNDAGQTFTTGPIQPNANSLPITVPTSTSYSVSPAGLAGTINIT
jgi:plastocyanin